jgi:hypothetical protein
LDEDTEKLLGILRGKVCWEDLGWGGVYIEAAVQETGWTKAELSGHLSVLKKAGLYERIDGFFGKVKLP